jgi:hypothetical protein
MVWLTQIGPILTALAGLLTAWAGYRRRRARASTWDAQQSLPCRRELADTQSRLYTALHHLYVLERFVAGHGLVPPVRPDLLRT